MVALLFTSIFIIGLVAWAFYLWAPRGKTSEQDALLPPEPPRWLFSDNHEKQLPVVAAAADTETARQALRERTVNGDKSALNEAHALGDRSFYTDLVRELRTQAQTKEARLALVSYVTRNELPVTHELANAIVADWFVAPDRSSTASTLHITALADDAEFYLRIVNEAYSFWQHRLLPNVSAAELRALFDGEFWVLSASTRNSAAGFILKRRLAYLRSELEDATRVKS